MAIQASTTLLAVRDDAVREVLTEALRLVGRHVRRVGDGRELFWGYVLAPGLVDLVVCDTRLPVYSVFDVADAWREFGRLPRLLLVSEDVSTQDARRVSGIGGSVVAVTRLERLCEQVKRLSTPLSPGSTVLS
ncbi:MAG TPA: response regulator [Polyangiaceae bacterium]